MQWSELSSLGRTRTTTTKRSSCGPFAVASPRLCAADEAELPPLLLDQQPFCAILRAANRGGSLLERSVIKARKLFVVS